MNWKAQAHIFIMGHGNCDKTFKTPYFMCGPDEVVLPSDNRSLRQHRRKPGDRPRGQGAVLLDLHWKYVLAKW